MSYGEAGRRAHGVSTGGGQAGELSVKGGPACRELPGEWDESLASCCCDAGLMQGACLPRRYGGLTLNNGAWPWASSPGARESAQPSAHAGGRERTRHCQTWAKASPNRVGGTEKPSPWP
ncbi:hypothetical protein KIL84_021648 [Mauremys mutica]|uniref:Uncharacterized protein n=1 Tax=Mauremys mutica TaxID=74926 RepID=A0A9D3X7C0_9SAUR|nr:hypothetical protein KIL84_021648 [Mauremys mutica]